MHKYYEINAQGHNIRCKLFFRETPEAENAVIFCTGFAGHKDNRAAEIFSEKLLSKHKNVVVTVFDWPAHGDDVKKRLTLADCDRYLSLVTADARERFGANRLYAYATSFGAYLVLKYITEHGSPFEKIALRCPVVDMYEVFSHTILKSEDSEKLRKGKDAAVGFDRKINVNRGFLEELQQNDLRQRDFLDWAESIHIFHGTADEVAPFESSRRFADDNLIEFTPIEKADHRFQNPTHMSLANKLVTEFFDLP